MTKISDKLVNDYIYFNSSSKSPYHLLSNFHQIDGGIKYDDIIYNSVEHAYQAQKFIKSDRIRFSETGDLGDFSAFRTYGSIFFKKSVDPENKIRYWSKKNNIGIVAKMASNPKYAKQLRLTFEKEKSRKNIERLFLNILLQKYSYKKYFDVLIDTKNSLLIEFSRSAKRNYDNGSVDMWTGMVLDGKLYGENLMGQYLMKIRDCLI